jgi:hypothetical protein
LSFRKPRSLSRQKLTLSLQGIFWLGSGLAIASALITLVFIPNIKIDAMRDEDVLVSEPS